MNQTPLQQELSMLLTQLAVNNKKAARMIGIGETSLRQWIANEYKSNPSNIEERVRNFIQREKEKRASVHLNIPYVDIKVARTVTKVLRTCHINGVMGLIYGESGLGKTTATSEYARLHPDTIYIEANRAYSAKILFRHLHQILGYPGRGATIDMMNDVIARLKDSGRLIIIDQAEYLNETTLHLLRTVYDKARVGVAIVGTQELYRLVTRKKGELAQVLTRITVTAALSPWIDSDVDDVVTAALPKFKHYSGDFARFAHGNGMMLKNLLFNTLQCSTANDVNPKLIEQASKFSLK
jgi:DNA transposition AAA+ family ATPase